MKAILVILSLAVISCTQAISVPEYKELEQLCCPVESDWAGVDGSHASWTDSNLKFNAYEVPQIEQQSELSLSGWRGETVMAQAVVWSRSGMNELTYEFRPLKRGLFGRIDKDNAELGFVRYVMADGPNPEEGNSNCGDRSDRSRFDSTMVADCIDPYTKSLELKPMNARAIWMSLRIPRGVEPGTYCGELLIKDGSSVIERLKIRLNASENVLPEAKDWDFHLDLWQNPYSVARYHNVEPWSKEHLDYMRPLMTRLAQAGQKVITATITYKPWNGQTEDHYDTMVEWIKKEDGKWSFDYSDFDVWVEFMMSCGITKQINCFSMVPWRREIRYYDESAQDYGELLLVPGTEEYNSIWSEFLSQFATHLKSKGWLDKCAIAMDERPLDIMLQTIAVIKKYGFKISLAGTYHEELDADLHDYCALITDYVPRESIEKRRAEGKVTTLYTCCVPRVPNTFVYSKLEEAVWTNYLIAARGVDGFLRWAYNSWPIDPLRDSRFRSHASGDTFIIYPDNRSSLRFEKMLEGIQACEKINILRKRYAQNGDNARLDALEQALSGIEYVNIYSGDIHSDILRVKSLLE